MNGYRMALPVVLIVAALSACTQSVGVKVDEKQVAQFQKGTTTMDEVIAKLGPPSTRYQSSSGYTLSYMFASSTASGANFVPVVNMFKAHTDSSSQSCIFMFDENRRYKSYSCSETQAAQNAPLSR